MCAAVAGEDSPYSRLEFLCARVYRSRVTRFAFSMERDRCLISYIFWILKCDGGCILDVIWAF